MNLDFKSMSHDMYNFLLEKAQNMEDPELVEHGGTTSGRIHQSIHGRNLFFRYFSGIGT